MLGVLRNGSFMVKTIVYFENRAGKRMEMEFGSPILMPFLKVEGEGRNRKKVEEELEAPRPSEKVKNISIIF